MDARAIILIGETDNYDGVTLTIEEPMDAEVFAERLRASLSHWRQEVFTSIPLSDFKALFFTMFLALF